MVKVSAGVRAAVQIFFNECATNPKRYFLQCVVNSWTASLHVASPREKKDANGATELSQGPTSDIRHDTQSAPISESATLQKRGPRVRWIKY